MTGCHVIASFFYFFIFFLEKTKLKSLFFLTGRENLARFYKFENCCCCCDFVQVQVYYEQFNHFMNWLIVKCTMNNSVILWRIQWYYVFYFVILLTIKLNFRRVLKLKFLIFESLERSLKTRKFTVMHLKPFKSRLYIDLFNCKGECCDVFWPVTILNAHFTRNDYNYKYF